MFLDTSDISVYDDGGSERFFPARSGMFRDINDQKFVIWRRSLLIPFDTGHVGVMCEM